MKDFGSSLLSSKSETSFSSVLVMFSPIFLNLMNLVFLGHCYLKGKRRTGESKLGNSRPLCPKEIFLKQSLLFGGGRNGRGRLTLQGNLVVLKWPLKPKTMEKFKEKHKVIGDK